MSETPSSGSPPNSGPEWAGRTAVVSGVIAALTISRNRSAGLVVGGLAAAAGLAWISNRGRKQENVGGDLISAPNGLEEAQLIVEETVSSQLNVQAEVDPVESELDDDEALLLQMLNPPVLKPIEPKKASTEAADSRTEPEDDFACLMGPMIWEQGPDLVSLSYTESETVWYGLNGEGIREPATAEVPTTEMPEVSELVPVEFETDVLPDKLDESLIEPEVVNAVPIEVAVAPPEDHLVEKLSIFSLDEGEGEGEGEESPTSESDIHTTEEENPFKLRPKQDNDFVVTPKQAPAASPEPRKAMATSAYMIETEAPLPRLLPVEDVAVRDVGSRVYSRSHPKMEPLAPAGQLSSAKPKPDTAGWRLMTIVLLIVAALVAAVWWNDQSEEGWKLPFVERLGIKKKLIEPDSMSFGTKAIEEAAR